MSMLTQLSTEIQGCEAYCVHSRPACIVVLGDRDEALAGALVGSHAGIPVLHIHGGDVSGSENVDELIRHAITKLSHIHCVATPKSFKRVCLLGEEPSRVHLVGAPGLDELRTEKYMSRKDFAKHFGLDPEKEFIVMVQHPSPLDEVPVDTQIRETITALQNSDAEKIVIYPNADTGSHTIIQHIQKVEGTPGWHVQVNMPRSMYINALKHARVMVGNSSSGIIEAGYFKLPVVNIGSRQKGREAGKNVLHARYDARDIHKKVMYALSTQFRMRIKKMEHPYGSGRSGEKIVRVLERSLKNPSIIHKQFTYADL